MMNIQNFSTLPTKIIHTSKGVVRRESIEIIDDSILVQTPRVRRSISTAAKTLAPSKNFSWNSKVKSDQISPQIDLIKKSHFHAICYRSLILERKQQYSDIRKMKWLKMHMVVFDDVIIFFKAENYQFESRLHFSTIKAVKRIKIGGNSTTYFGTTKPFVIRFQKRSDRILFRKIVPKTYEQTKSVNLSQFELEDEDKMNLTIEDDDVFDSPAAPTVKQTEPRTRLRATSTPVEHSNILRTQFGHNFKSLRRMGRSNTLKTEPKKLSFIDSMLKKMKLKISK